MKNKTKTTQKPSNSTKITMIIIIIIIISIRISTFVGNKNKLIDYNNNNYCAFMSTVIVLHPIVTAR